ncbi:asparaginase [bacterium]|nr:asparaginase [bacterium]
MNNIPPVLVSFIRGKIVESRHRGWICIVDSSGKLLYSEGNPMFSTFLRSSAKPLQSVAVVLTGASEKYDLKEAEMSIISGSHGGEPFHVDTVRSILSKCGMNEDMLQNGPHPPLDETARKILKSQGKTPLRLHHNCSGKHAGMLAATKVLGGDLGKYLDPESPVQQKITNVIGAIAGIEAGEIELGIDGCSAPVHSLSMYGSALAYARLLDPVDLDADLALACKRVTRAIRMYPEMIAAQQGRICTELIRAGKVFELIAKGGAEGFYSAGWRDSNSGRGIGLSIKIEDGSQRARDPLVIKVLQNYGVLPNELGQELKTFESKPIFNFAKSTVGKILIEV